MPLFKRYAICRQTIDRAEWLQKDYTWSKYVAHNFGEEVKLFRKDAANELVKFLEHHDRATHFFIKRI